MIDLTPTDEQDDMISWAGGLLDQELPAEQLMMTDLQSFPVVELAGRLAQMGWFGFSAAADQGGAGLRLVDEALMFRELGRRIVPGPLLSTTLAARVAVASGSLAVAADLIGGKRLAGLAEVRTGGDVVVWDAGPADYLLVVDANRSRLSLISTDGLPATSFADSIDPFYRLATLEAAQLPQPIACVEDADAEGLLGHGRVLVAAVLTGLAEGARDHSAAYAKERVQFGKPIGAFQAVKHRCADTALRAEAAWAQTAVAAIRLADLGPEMAQVDVAAAKVVAGDAAIRNARDNIQNHGGLGYTAENEAHLFLKRSHILANTLGDARSLTGILLDGACSW
jgi:alkylation response protein AidB-like acyl-CoA dehydrogenase